MPAQDNAVTRDILALLDTLHRHKDAAYGAAWRKRGEVIAIFANMARKYDRLVIAFNEERPAATEPLADTVADLCVYAAKYLTWIADEHPEEFAKAELPLPPPAKISAARGPEAVSGVFAAVADHAAIASASVPGAWLGVRETFAALERALMAQATIGTPSDQLIGFTAKANLAWTLTLRCAALLTSLQRDDPAVMDRLAQEVAAMEER